MLGESGHNWVNNWDPAPGETIASNKGSYVASVFDEAHDNGFRTGEYASKSKFVLFATSWDAVSGAPDLTGVDNGNNKIDVFEYQPDTAVLVQHLVENMTNCSFGYVFLHLADLDCTGHSYGWDDTPGSVYSSALIDLDGRLGEIFAIIDSTPLLKGQTAII